MMGFAIEGEIAIDGDMTIYRAAEIKPLLMSSLGDPGPLDLDLSRVTELDSSGVQLLMLARHLCTQREKPLRIIAPSDAVLEVFQLLDLESQFAVIRASPKADV